MNGSKKLLCNPDSNEPLILRAYKQKVARSERYYFYEKDKGRLIHLNENYYADESADVVQTIKKQHLQRALRLALSELDDLEKQIIDECFFDENCEKVTFTELAKHHGISRPGYLYKLRRILEKLKKSVEMLYEEF
ncbi:MULTISPECIES: hypothetical protein [unclassified Ruminococcus]|uniref:hypothetical protein n=1 Tax=unclassified Ruminococcus TaxID=2608920 RepID=UPI00210B396D|nr:MULTISPECIES: hypothetical protein [unclassified Ruminococcus]MCQ4021711.1 hypothetical protein [Ruminococcus sp. zg-924]MCQ4114156.1 hypothetical protein [Ruminococcus sp. zg-921]